MHEGRVIRNNSIANMSLNIGLRSSESVHSVLRGRIAIISIPIFTHNLVLIHPKLP